MTVRRKPLVRAIALTLVVGVPLLVVLPLAGYFVGVEVGEAACDEPADAWLRCLGHELVGGLTGALVGLAAAVGLFVAVIRYASRRVQRGT